jgi:hypothetical protein
MECAQKLVDCADEDEPARHAQLPFRTAGLAVSVIHCNDAPARRLLLGDRPRMRRLEFLEKAIVTIIEEAIGPARHPPPFTDPWDILEAGEGFKAAMAEGFPPAGPAQLSLPALGWRHVWPPASSLMRSRSPIAASWRSRAYGRTGVRRPASGVRSFAIVTTTPNELLVGTVFGAVNFIVALLLAPETKGKELVPDLVVAEPMVRPTLRWREADSNFQSLD